MKREDPGPLCRGPAANAWESGSLPAVRHLPAKLQAETVREEIDICPVGITV